MRKLFSWPTTRPISLKLVSSVFRRTRHHKFLDELMVDLLESAWITLAIYFSLFVLFYISIASDRLADPSQSIDCGRRRDHDESFTSLAQTVQTLLNRLGLDRNTFICYSTLYDLLRTGRTESNRLDLCVYDPSLEPTGFINPVLYVLGWSQLERELSNAGVRYEFDRLFGHYRLSHMNSQVYLYIFGRSPTSKRSFESIRRFGVFYLQFERLFDALGGDSNGSRINWLNRFQTYMVEEMFIRVSVTGGNHSFFPMPVDPFDMLANLYPDLWYKSQLINC